MAGGMDLGTKHGKGRKSLDVTINLVPFIDLMAVTIAFLIMTAVWTQVGRMQVSSSGGAEPGEAPQPPETVTVRITLDRLTLHRAGLEVPLALKRGSAGAIETEGLEKELERLRASAERPLVAMLEAADEVAYEDVVRLVDACMAAGLKDVTVAGASG